MKTIYVIAGNSEEYLRYHEKNALPNVAYLYVRNCDSLKSLKLLDPDGIFIGTWYYHPDIYHILQELTLACEDPKKQEIIQTVRKKFTDYIASKMK